MTFSSLPNDILRLIADELTSKAIYSLTLVSHHISDICLQEKTQERLQHRLARVVVTRHYTAGVNDPTTFKRILPNGKQHGFDETYRSNGQLTSQWSWKNGKLDGPVLNWYDNGTLAGRHHWKSNVPDGPVESWDQDGHLTARRYCENGRLHGLEEQWYSDGELVLRNVWDHGVLISSYDERLHVVALRDMNNLFDTRKQLD